MIASPWTPDAKDLVEIQLRATLIEE